MTERICNQISDHEHADSPIKRTAIVVSITLITMIAEIGYGFLTGSMALLADGIHMGTHTFALIVTLAAYLFAKSQAENPGFAFSSGKVGILGGYTNAIILGITALYMVYEAVHRLINPETIIFNQALLVAGIGLTVNLISAFLLSSGGHDHHGHDHSHESHHDHNLRSAYVHVITDALTSVLAIVALLTGKLTGQTWPDAAVAMLGAAVILKWAWDLLVSSGKLLVDYHPSVDERAHIQAIAGESGSRIKDLHIWKSSENHKVMIVKLEAGENFSKEVFTGKVRAACRCQHLTLEIG